MMRIKKYILEILILSIVSVLIFYSSDPIIYSDTTRYVQGNAYDPPLFHMIIFIMDSIFKTLNSIIVLQTFLIGFAIIFFLKTISKYFDLNIFVKLLITLFLLIPIMEFYNHLLTEPFSYAFSIFFVSFVIRLIYNFNILNLILTSFFVIVLLLMRNQFVFLYPVVLFLYLKILYIYKSKKKIILLTTSFISIILIHNLCISLNKHIHSETLENKTTFNSSTGAINYIFVDAVYISSIQDVGIFEDNELKKTLNKIFQETNEKKISLKHYNGRGHFGYSYPIIIELSNVLLNELATQKGTEVFNLKKEILIKLIKKNFKKYIKLIFKKFYDSSWLFVFLPFFILLSAFPIFLKKKTNFSLFLVFLSTFVLTNHSIIYLFGRVQPRYFIYTDLILLVFVFISFYIFLQKKVK